VGAGFASVPKSCPVWVNQLDFVFTFAGRFLPSTTRDDRLQPERIMSDAFTKMMMESVGREDFVKKVIDQHQSDIDRHWRRLTIPGSPSAVLQGRRGSLDLLDFEETFQIRLTFRGRVRLFLRRLTKRWRKPEQVTMRTVRHFAVRRGP